MELTEKEIKNYNEMFQERYGRDATDEELYEIKRTVYGLAEIIYKTYLYNKKIGRLPEIFKEIENEKLEKQ